MSFTLEQHCEKIIKDRAIDNRILVLCEGEFKHSTENNEALTIKAQAEKIQDAYFYTNAIPKWWQKDMRKPLPVFYPCGSQKNVIDCYFYLKDLHKIEKPSYSHLNHHKLFALVDIDLQGKTLPHKKYPDINYPFKNLEEIYKDLQHFDIALVCRGDLSRPYARQFCN